MFSLYRRLIAERRASPALRRGSYRTIDAGPAVFAYARESGDERRLILLNFGDVPAQARTGRATVIVSTDPGRPEEQLDGSIELAPDEGVLLRV
jgi:alpha-glucosidase